jgi:hypothetical protein
MTVSPVARPFPQLMPQSIMEVEVSFSSLSGSERDTVGGTLAEPMGTLVIESDWCARGLLSTMRLGFSIPFLESLRKTPIFSWGAFPKTPNAS